MRSNDQRNIDVIQGTLEKGVKTTDGKYGTKLKIPEESYFIEGEIEKSSESVTFLAYPYPADGLSLDQNHPRLLTIYRPNCPSPEKIDESTKLCKCSVEIKGRSNPEECYVTIKPPQNNLAEYIQTHPLRHVEHQNEEYLKRLKINLNALLHVMLAFCWFPRTSKGSKDHATYKEITSHNIKIELEENTGKITPDFTDLHLTRSKSEKTVKIRQNFAALLLTCLGAYAPSSHKKASEKEQVSQVVKETAGSTSPNYQNPTVAEQTLNQAGRDRLLEIDATTAKVPFNAQGLLAHDPHQLKSRVLLFADRMQKTSDRERSNNVENLLFVNSLNLLLKTSEQDMAEQEVLRARLTLLCLGLMQAPLNIAGYEKCEDLSVVPANAQGKIFSLSTYAIDDETLALCKVINGLPLVHQHKHKHGKENLISVVKRLMASGLKIDVLSSALRAISNLPENIVSAFAELPEHVFLTLAGDSEILARINNESRQLEGTNPTLYLRMVHIDSFKTTVEKISELEKLYDPLRKNILTLLQKHGRVLEEKVILKNYEIQLNNIKIFCNRYLKWREHKNFGLPGGSDMFNLIRHGKLRHFKQVQDYAENNKSSTTKEILDQLLNEKILQPVSSPSIMANGSFS